MQKCVTFEIYKEYCFFIIIIILIIIFRLHQARTCHQTNDRVQTGVSFYSKLPYNNKKVFTFFKSIK